MINLLQVAEILLRKLSAAAAGGDAVDKEVGIVLDYNGSAGSGSQRHLFLVLL